jgi:2-polyprenyl-6-hydroxyphenyl methylase/3-demethylubiquinone-9 3-methyltransferase
MEREVVNNAFYDDLGKQWYEAYNHPIALLRAENKARAPWVIKKIAEHFSQNRCSLLDIGCGGGFLSNTLAQHGHQVTGIDISEESLHIAREMDSTRTVNYCKADGYKLPFSSEQFEIVCAMDLLEHVEEPTRVIAEASRVLKPGGIFFFHTFNRNWFSWLIALKGVEWFVPNTPENMHLYRLFIKPREMTHYLKQNNLKVSEILGLMPAMDKGFFQLILQRRISTHFSFKIISSLKCGYMGHAIK